MENDATTVCNEWPNEYNFPFSFFSFTCFGCCFFSSLHRVHVQWTWSIHNKFYLIMAQWRWLEVLLLYLIHKFRHHKWISSEISNYSSRNRLETTHHYASSKGLFVKSQCQIGVLSSQIKRHWNLVPRQWFLFCLDTVAPYDSKICCFDWFNDEFSF